MTERIVGDLPSHSNTEQACNEAEFHDIPGIPDVGSLGPTIHKVQARVAICGGCNRVIGSEGIRVDARTGQRWLEGHRPIDCAVALTRPF